MKFNYPGKRSCSPSAALPNTRNGAAIPSHRAPCIWTTPAFPVHLAGVLEKRRKRRNARYFQTIDDSNCFFQDYSAQRGAFTLFELLVVTTIISILASLVLSVFSMARTQARKVVCMSQLRQMGIAAIGIKMDRHGEFPEGDPFPWNISCWPTNVAGTIARPAESDFGFPMKMWICPNDYWGRKIPYWSAISGVAIDDATALTMPYLGRLVTSYQYLANIPFGDYPWEITRGKNNSPDHVLAGDLMADGPDPLSSHRDGGNQLWQDGSVQWVRTSDTSIYYNNYFSFRLALTRE